MKKGGKRKRRKPIHLYGDWRCGFCNEFNWGSRAHCAYCRIRADYAIHLAERRDKLPKNIDRIFEMAKGYYISLKYPYKETGRVKKTKS